MSINIKKEFEVAAKEIIDSFVDKKEQQFRLWFKKNVEDKGIFNPAEVQKLYTDLRHCFRQFQKEEADGYQVGQHQRSKDKSVSEVEEAHESESKSKSQVASRSQTSEVKRRKGPDTKFANNKQGSKSKKE